MTQAQYTAPYKQQEQQKKSKRRGLLIAGFILATTAVPLYFMFYPEYERSQLIKNGLSAEGIIVSIEDTGNRFNDQPQVKVTVDVQPKNDSAFKAAAKMIVSPVHLPQFQPGKKVQVRYDPADPSKIAIESVQNQF